VIWIWLYSEGQVGQQFFIFYLTKKSDCANK